ncbi:flagellar basal body-associated FliL family protein [Fulvimonas soli]|jgi:flagellar FliL protein|uniref:Flagellar protein FliL n=1 Tax=Fulvimonas soli TaxID=155197 RepID=A0A316HXS6_9GAMM|nr:flagellar basal body-associated FliL family protein [Fulvimonas soli]PWK83074.1 flagellar FliL protein [Fulvimonas soli]TNY25854.1 flagellar basal body protein FliL [Fulvimonas soli]
MAQTEQEVAQAAPNRRGSLLVIVLLVALVAALGVSGYALFALRSHAPAAAAAEAEPPKSKQELYLPLDPAFVVNFRDDQSMRFLQVGVSLMSHDQAALDAAKAADPVIRDALVKLFSSQDYAILSDAAGKQKLQAQALEAVRRIVAARYGKPGIEALYFTSFVMQ